MRNVMKGLVNAWFDLLDGNLSYDTHGVNVYKKDAPSSEKSHYVLIYPESETDDSNKASFVTKPVIVIDIVTIHPVSIKFSIVEDIYDQVVQLVFPSRHHALRSSEDFQIMNVSPATSVNLEGHDGVNKTYRKVTRFFHRLNQF